MKQIIKRAVCRLLAFALVLHLLPAAFAYTNVSNWARPEVRAMEELGLLPDSLDDADLTKQITRLDMCRIAVLAYERMTGLKLEQPAEHPFTDTQDPDVEKAFGAGLVKGKDAGKFMPGESLSRVDFFAFVSQFITAVGFAVEDGMYADLSAFSDAASMPQWAVKHAQLTVGLGVVKGSDGGLDWSSLATAEQAIAMFYRAYLKVTEADRFPNASNWAMPSLAAMYDLGLVPENVAMSDQTGPITRGDMCKVAMRAYKLLTGIGGDEMGKPESPFTDTKDSDIALAARLGIVSGYQDGTFRPNDAMTRQEYFKITVNLLNAIGYLYNDDETVDLSDYGDSEELYKFAISPARLLISIGAVNGDTDRNLNPTDTIVCQEALAIFYRIHDFVTTWVASSAEDNRSQITRDKAQQVVDLAMKYLGWDYISGGKDPSHGGFDCSGFVYYLYKATGIKTDLYPGCSTQWRNLPDVIIPRDQLLPGDLVFFSYDDSEYLMDHVALYIGNNQIIHANTPSTGIIISDLNEPFYVRNYAGAKRIVND